MSDDTQVTPKMAMSPVRADSLHPKLWPFLSERALEIFKNVNIETMEASFHFGRIVTSETPFVLADFAHRLNKLFDTFDGEHGFDCKGSEVRPIIKECLSSPIVVRLHPLPGQAHRLLYITYVFVNGLPLVGEEARRWLNNITKSFIYAAREGELPVNSEQPCP